MIKPCRLSRRALLHRVRHWSWRISWLLLGLGLVAYAHAHAIHPVIELASLKAKLARHTPHLLLVDVRSRAAYLAGHLPGAINLPASLTRNNEKQHGIASLQQVRKVLSQAGIRHSDYLVLYDNGLLKQAAHVFWVMETYGHRKISVLDGGYPGWLADHGLVSQQVTRLPPSHYVPNISAHHLSTELATVIATHSPHIQIIDARSHREFLGLISRARRKGHIVNAINVPWRENLAQTQPYPKLKSRRALRALYSMLRPGEHVIAYCNRSMESAVTYLALRRLGVPVSIFDGAWLAWGNDKYLPIATGPATQGLANAQ